jgi:hypothetical protein
VALLISLTQSQTRFFEKGQVNQERDKVVYRHKDILQWQWPTERSEGGGSYTALPHTIHLFGENTKLFGENTNVHICCYINAHGNIVGYMMPYW